MQETINGDRDLMGQIQAHSDRTHLRIENGDLTTPLLKTMSNMSLLEFLSLKRMNTDLVEISEILPFLQLRTLKIKQCTFQDTLIAQLIQSMNGATEIKCYALDFMDYSFDALQLHFSTLEYINLYRSESVRSDMLGRILEECPKLRYLKASRMDSIHIQNMRCLHLQDFRVVIKISESDNLLQENRRVLAALGTLHELRVLDCGSPTGDDNNRALSFTMETGLGLLVGLRLLWKLTVGKCERQRAISLDDARWMTTNWTGLRCLSAFVEENRAEIENHLNGILTHYTDLDTENNAVAI